MWTLHTILLLLLLAPCLCMYPYPYPQASSEHTGRGVPSAASCLLPPDAHFDAETAAEDRLRRRSALLLGRDQGAGGTGMGHGPWAMGCGPWRETQGCLVGAVEAKRFIPTTASVHAAHVSTWALAVSSFVMVQLLSLAVWFGRQKDPSKTK
ncbi:hypothetical protein JI435_440480 [Parastagonospora nodorum SN15]|uniref:Uncharacterized protein n=1 Tax=Phaeosphaeria nodorum (strain SN15 / ATCC MYA-4574 / FGSC 10173) TaxID=321614 RepID=A0A7U2I6X8_PHANO|nr:hypothetical protein HBH50_138370 [Parastagonospora nodorum]QRD02212.1 hypothetical protein JI435_440480 [Parastagonospora nodorum SN15]KAH4140443.1 hypothetical protein HBH45_084430 [Parastagonospora nodorum]KAH4155776.1 hypothetical protein HBH44_138360 [Parastagonospora nodorum]KAH4176317.1 hypothetical protein HBH43_056750 [Parastagonospora nodorum]